MSDNLDGMEKELQELRDRLEKRGILSADGELINHNLDTKVVYTGDVSDEDAEFMGLVEFGERMGGVVVSEDKMTPEELERIALQRALGENLQRPHPSQGDRIESMITQLMARMRVLEEEVVFVSSANRFAHLRSGVEVKTDGTTIPRLPPAPDWSTLETYVEPFMRDILDHIKGAPVLKERATVTGMLPMDVLKGIDTVGEELLKIVGERGRAYGEEAILAMGEAGLISMIMSKVMRLMWSHRAGFYFQSRRDSYIDLAGYCLLTIALDKFVTEKSE